MSRLAALAAAVLVLVLVAPPAGLAASAPVCPNIPLPDRLELAPVAFVGRLLSSREAGGATYWRFAVDQDVKGVTGTKIDVRASALTDATGKPLQPELEVGVLAGLDGATVVTDSCGLTDPAALLSVADEARGAGIKLVLGGIVLVIVLAVCWIRIRRGSRPSFPGVPGPGPPAPRPPAQ